MKDLTERQKECVEAYLTHGENDLAAAKALGINEKTLRNNLWMAAKKGTIVFPDRFSENLPTGFGLTKVSRYTNAKGNWQVWEQGVPSAQNLDMLIAYLEKRVPTSPLKLKDVTNYDPKVMLQIDLADVHYGQLSWGRETRGVDYDMKIARSLIEESMEEVFSRTGLVNETLLVLYGDNFHTDFFSAVTEHSRHSLDTDSRYPKMVFTGAETYISAIEIAMMHSKKVRVIVLYGNHDNQTSVNLQYILHVHFRLKSPDRVTVDLEPSRTRYHVWGVTASNFHHGDKTTPARLAADVMRYVAENDIQGIREYRANQAHLHREDKKDINGVIYECKSSPVAPDAFAAGSHFASRRAVIATTFHKDYGEMSRYTVTPRMLERKREEILLRGEP